MVLATGGAVALHWLPAAGAHVPPLASALGIPTSLPTARGVLLTFDDGPHPQGTPAVLAELERAQAQAVFFVVGEQVARYPAVAREIANAGHEVALHGFRHQTRRQWLRRIVEDDTRRGLEIVAQATGTMPRLYRPPHGAFSFSGLRLIRSLGLRPLLWSRWGRDWEDKVSPSSIAARVTTDVEAGDVVLLHDSDHYSATDSWQRTVAALPLIFERLGHSGLEPEALPVEPALPSTRLAA